MICTYCQAPEEMLQSRGHKGNRHVYLCRNCGHFPSYDEELSSFPKVLIFDIENSYLETAIWRTGKQVVNHKQVLRDWYILSYAAKWLFDKKVYSRVVTPQEAVAGNDFSVVSEIVSLIDEADFVVTYNGNSHDIPKTLTRAIYHGINPPNYFKSIDVYTTVANRFSFTSNSLGYVNHVLSLEEKKHNEGLDLWTKCMQGDRKALDEMLTYNIGDVIGLEDTYLKFRPYIPNHPNFGVYFKNMDDGMCGYCCSTNITITEKYFPTSSGLYNSFICNDCGGHGRISKNILSKNKRKNLTRI